MAVTGLGDFMCETTVDGGSAKFHFYDPLDPSNTADASVAPSDFPGGVTSADSRQVLDVAYGLVSKQLNDKRDERLKKEAIDELNERTDKQAAAREATAEFHANAKDLSDTDTRGEVNPDLDKQEAGAPVEENGKKKS